LTEFAILLCRPIVVHTLYDCNQCRRFFQRQDAVEKRYLDNLSFRAYPYESTQETPLYLYPYQDLGTILCSNALQIHSATGLKPYLQYASVSKLEIFPHQIVILRLMAQSILQHLLFM